MIVVKHTGNFNKTTRFLDRAKNFKFMASLDRYGREGVMALSSATPVDSGKTSNSWSYEIHSTKNEYSICWTNSNINDGVPIAIILQYGHGTRNGGYVRGRDYINPAIRPIFDKIADHAWKELTRD